MKQDKKLRKENPSSLRNDPAFIKAFNRGRQRFEEEGRKKGINRGSLRNNPTFIEAVRKGKQKFSEEGGKYNPPAASRFKKGSETFLEIAFQPKLI